MPQKVALDNWPRRRRVIHAALAFCAFNMVWILLDGRDTALNQQAFLALAGSAVSIILGYTLGAVADDKFKRDAGEPTATPPPTDDFNFEEEPR